MDVRVHMDGREQTAEADEVVEVVRIPSVPKVLSFVCVAIVMY